ncbi:hypothetical protein [Bifidobacterium sp. SO4]|uniref:hypothetical protein n=1 Tax=Bifidobacterium sp. SO4 TaxID=2809030 RepID=UPI001BDC6B54|nr:hypothetical protein [Bifidobacterium sp. SO4]MBT1171758.1 hypothetical protein [Bifidobacterium sp. SO4]
MNGKRGDEPKVLHLCEWYEDGRRYVAQFETLADGSMFAVTDDWSTGEELYVNHALARPDGTAMPGIERLRFFDLPLSHNGCCRRDDYTAWEIEVNEQIEHDRFDDELRALGVLDDGDTIFGRP